MNNGQEKITIMHDNKLMEVEPPSEKPFRFYLLAGLVLATAIIIFVLTALYPQNQTGKEAQVVPEKVTGKQIPQKPQSATEGGIIPGVRK